MSEFQMTILFAIVQVERLLLTPQIFRIGDYQYDRELFAKYVQRKIDSMAFAGKRFKGIRECDTL